MAKRKMVAEKQLRIIHGNVTKEFLFKAYQAVMTTRVKHEGLVVSVQITGYSVYVSERWTRDSEVIYQERYDTGHISSRANEIAHVLRLFQKCDTIPEMKLVLQPLLHEFTTAIKKDAKRELLRQLKHNNHYHTNLNNRNTRPFTSPD